MPDRFYCPTPPIEGRFTLDRDEARHLSRVLRRGVGDLVEIFDGRGFATLGQVIEMGKDRVELVAQGEPLPDREAACHLTLATAVPKGERFDWLVEKATEIGVARLIPLITERSVVVPGDSKVERLRRAVVEASKQCGRNRLMELEDPTPWTLMVASGQDGTRLLAHPGGQPPSSWPRVPGHGSVVLAVGPEGGFTEAEAAAARTAGWVLISLGSTLLRVETAALAGSAAILTLCEG